MIFVIRTLLDRPHRVCTLSIKSQHSLGSVIPPAIVHIAVHAAQCRLNEKKAKSEEREGEREIGGTLSVEVVVELAPGPPHPSEVG